AGRGPLDGHELALRRAQLLEGRVGARLAHPEARPVEGSRVALDPGRAHVAREDVARVSLDRHDGEQPSVLARQTQDPAAVFHLARRLEPSALAPRIDDRAPTLEIGV